MAELFGTTLGQILRRAVRLTLRPWVLGFVSLLSVGGSALVTVKVFSVPGYELAAVVTLFVGLFGSIVGVSAARLERRLQLETNTSIPWGASGSVMLPFLASSLVLCTAAGIPAAVATVRSLLSTECSPFAHAVFYPLLVAPTCLLVSAVGVMCGYATVRSLNAAWLVIALIVGSALHTAWPILFGPQVFAFNFFGGYLPGPLYDEALSLRPAVLWFRLETSLWAAAALAASVFLLNTRTLYLRRPRFRPGALLILIASAAGIVQLESRATALGTRMSAAALADELGGLRATDRFLLYYPRGKKREDVDRLVRDLEFRYAQLAAFLGGPPPAKLLIYVHRNEADKGRLVGASRTQFAKPWRYELHLNDGEFPHPSAKHELAHSMAAGLGARPFGVTARFFGLWPLIGIIEGFAVAADNPMDQLSLHEWAAGMRREKLAPDVRKILKPTGFYTSAPARAYTMAGSFIRYLAETHGPNALRTLYAHGDFEKAYGRTLEGLADEWEKFLDTVPLDESDVSQAFARFRQGSLFARACAREVATLKERADQSLASDPEEAERLYTRCSEIQPEDPSYWMGRANALMRQDRPKDALSLLQEWEPKVQNQPQLHADTLMTQADAAWRMGEAEKATALLKKILALKPSPSLTRTAHVKLAATDGSAVSSAIWAYFQPAADELKLLRLKEASSVDPDNPYLNYLLGRRLLQANAPNLAAAYLVRALTRELPDSLRKESLRLKLQAEFESGDCDAVAQTAGQLPGFGAAFKGAADEWNERCQFEKKTYSKLLSPQEPFR